MAATAVWALWTTAEHVGSMARPTTDDNITVYDDAVFCDSETQKTCVWTQQACRPCLYLECSVAALSDMSAAIKQPSDSDHGTGPQREVQAPVAHAEHDSAPMC